MAREARLAVRWQNGQATAGKGWGLSFHCTLKGDCGVCLGFCFESRPENSFYSLCAVSTPLMTVFFSGPTNQRVHIRSNTVLNSELPAWLTQLLPDLIVVPRY